jgi:glutathione S-transferase
VAGERFSIADITLPCGLEFARGPPKFKPADEGFAHLVAWRERMNDRACPAAPWLRALGRASTCS